MNRNFEDLVQVVKKLRSPEGCPWDRKQNLFSIKNDFIEEAFELLDALDNEDLDNIREELGDVLFHVVFHAEMAESEGHFTLSEIISEICEKLIRRHPHVFAGESVSSTDEVMTNWDRIKQQEKGSSQPSALDGVPAKFPPVLEAIKLQQKARKTGFDWDSTEDCLSKVQEEYEEFLDAVASGDTEKIEHELGDIMFALINSSRFLGVNADEALRKCNKRFTERFRYIERSLADAGADIGKTSLKEMEALWQEAKKNSG